MDNDKSRKVDDTIAGLKEAADYALVKTIEFFEGKSENALVELQEMSIEDLEFLLEEALKREMYGACAVLKNQIDLKSIS